MSEAQGQLTLDGVIAEFEAAWRRLSAAIARFPAERAEESGVTGDWSLKILVGHIAFWDRFEADHLPRRHEMLQLDWQAMNDASLEEIRPMSFADAKSDLETQHDRLTLAMRQPCQVELERLRELTCAHYVEHAAEIEAWFDRNA